MSDPVSPESIPSLPEPELVRALTVERSRYGLGLIETLAAELDSRGATLDALRHAVVVQESDGTFAATTATDCPTHLTSPLDEWSVRVFRNVLGDGFALQRLPGTWVLHLATDIGYVGFRQAASPEEFASELTTYLSCEASTAEATSGMGGWEPFVQSRTPRVVEDMAAEFAKAGISYVVHSPRLAGLLPAFGEAAVSQLLIPEDVWKEAEAISDRRAGRSKELFEAADAAAERGDTKAELSFYDELITLTPDDAMLVFNRGVALNELGQKEAAADSFMDAIPLMFGDEALHAHIPDVRSVLEELLPQVNDRTPLQHALAGLAISLHEPKTALGLFKEALNEKEDDAAAHLGIAQILYEDGDADDDAILHFQRHLELDPASSGRDTIEAILVELTDPTS